MNAAAAPGGEGRAPIPGEERHAGVAALAQRRVPEQRQRALVVCNVQAARGATTVGVALRVFSRYDLECQVEIPQTAAETCSMVREGRRRFDVVIVAGGDGTLHAALPALRGTGAPIGILPCGTANDFARTLGIPLAVESAAESLLAGRVRWIDVGWVNGHPFLNVAHIGLGARARDAVSGSQKHRWGRGSYPMAVLAALRRVHPFRFCVTGAGRRSRMLVREVVGRTPARFRVEAGAIPCLVPPDADDSAGRAGPPTPPQHPGTAPAPLPPAAVGGGDSGSVPRAPAGGPLQ